MRKNVGYFDGTDCNLLNALVCDRRDTIPVSNGRDHHGQHVRLLNNENRYDLLVANLYKIVAPEDRLPEDATFQDVFHLCKVYSIPLLISVPEGLQAKAREILGDTPDVVRLVDPSEMLAVAREILA